MNSKLYQYTIMLLILLSSCKREYKVTQKHISKKQNKNSKDSNEKSLFSFSTISNETLKFKSLKFLKKKLYLVNDSILRRDLTLKNSIYIENDTSKARVASENLPFYYKVSPEFITILSHRFSIDTLFTRYIQGKKVNHKFYINLSYFFACEFSFKEKKYICLYARTTIPTPTERSQYTLLFDVSDKKNIKPFTFVNYNMNLEQSIKVSFYDTFPFKQFNDFDKDGNLDFIYFDYWNESHKVYYYTYVKDGFVKNLNYYLIVQEKGKDIFYLDKRKSKWF